MKKKILSYLFCLTLAFSFAQTTVTIGGGASVTCPATPTATWTTPPPGVTFSNWSRGSGVTCATASNALSGSGFNTASAAASLSANAFYSFTITAGATTNVNLTQIAWSTTISSGTANFAVFTNNNGSGNTPFGTAVTGISGSATNTFNGSVSIAAGTSCVVLLVPYGTGAATTTIRVVNGSTVTVTATASGITSAANGAWSNPATWVGGVVPTSAQNVIIAHNVTAGALTRNSGTTTTINTGASLAVSGTYTCTGATTTVNGTFQLNAGGWATGANFTYGPTGTLNFNNTSSYGVSNADVFWPTTNGPFNVNILQGGLTLNSASRTVAGTFATASGVTLNSSTLTLNGTCQINAGGFFAAGSAPLYGTSSTLRYNVNGNYGRSNEWISNVSGANGYPYNVQLSNNTNLIPGANSGSNTSWEIGGNLTIDAGSGFYMDFGSEDMNQPIRVLGDLNVSGGLSLSDNSGGDLKVRGNVAFNTGYSFNAKNRALFFTKNGTQTITAATKPTFHYLVFEPVSGTTTVQLSGTDLDITAPLTGNAINFGAAANVFDINGRTLTIGTPATACSIAGSSGTFKGSATSNLTLLGTGDIGTLRFTSGSQSLGTFTMNRTSGGAATLGTPLTVHTSYVMTSGVLDLGANLFTLIGTLSGTGSSTNMVIADGTGGEFRKAFTTTGSFTFPIGDNDAPDGTQFSPATVNFTAGTFSSAYVGMKVQDMKNINNDATTDFISRNWVMTSAGITSPTYNFTGTYTLADIAGTESNSNGGRWDGSSWTVGTACGSNSFSVNGLTDLPVTNEFNAGNPLKLAEINVKQSATNYLHNSTYAFGNVGIGVNSDVVFTIENLGLQNLTLGTATISGSGFVLQTNYATPVTGGNSTSFTIRFTPNATGAFSGSISIPNNDVSGGENPYIINFTGTGVPNNASDISFNAASPASNNSNIAYATYQSATISNTGSGAGGSIGVMGFFIRDGGSTLSDADNLGTELTAISFTVTNVANLRRAALFNGNTLIAEVAATSSPIVFTGLSGPNVTAADNSQLALNLRVTFASTVTDNQQVQFTVSSATANSAGSTFATANAGGAQSSIVGDINRIEVTADRLAFVQQPTNTSMNTNMAPAVTVEAEDVLGNRDLDFTGIVNITSTGTLTGSPVSATASAGLATYSTLQHSAVGTGLTLNAASTGLASATSVTFNITAIVYVNGDYRTTGGGTWVSNSATPAIWERFNGSTWAASNSPTYSTTNNVYIQNGHTITTGGSFGNSVNLKIMNGGIFNCNHSSTTASTYVYEGGTLNINASFTMAPGGAFDVEDNGNVNVNFAYGNPATSIWQGVENFRPNSNFTFISWDAANDILIPDNTTISTNTYNGYTAAFGNIICDWGTNLGASDDMIFLASGVNINMAHGDLIFRTNDNSFISPGTADMRISTTGTVTSGIGGDFLVEDTYGATPVINFKTSGTLVFTIGGDMILEASTTRILASSVAGSRSTVNINGNLSVTPSAVLDFNSTVAGGSPPPADTINLKGDLFVAGSGLLHNTNSSNNGVLNFTGTGNGLTPATTQTIDIASTSSNENRYITFVARSGSYVQQINRDFELGTNSAMIVEGGATFDFGFNGTTPLLTKISGSATGTTFTSQQGSTLKITSPDGISTTSGTGAGIGNVQTVASNRTFNQTATFHYIGKVNQVTGNAITVGSTPKVIICDLQDNSTQLSFTNPISITHTPTVDATYGGHLYIKRGQVIESTTAYITGSGGTLRMEPGTLYRVAKGSSTAAAAYANGELIPRLLSTINGTGDYYLNGGTIELAGTGAGDAFQVLRGAGRTYKNIKYSGANTFGTDYKALSSNAVIDSSLEISGNAVLDMIDVSGNPVSFTGNGGLVMTNGTASRLRIKSLNTTMPQLTATATNPSRSYNLTAGTIEFYGSGISGNQVIRATDGNGNNISFNKIDVHAAAANHQWGANFFNVSPSASFIIKDSLNVYSPAVFRLDETENVSGTGSITVHDGATLLYGAPLGITTAVGNMHSTVGNIGVAGARNLSTSASYGFVGNGNMVSGNQLPKRMRTLYIDKAIAQNLVSLTDTIEATDSIVFKTAGIIRTGSSLLYLSNPSASSLKGFEAVNATGVYTNDKYVFGNLRRALNAATTYVFPIGDTVTASATVGERYNPIELIPTTVPSSYVTAKFMAGAPGSITVPKTTFACGANTNFVRYTGMTGQGWWNLEGTGQTFTYNVRLHPNLVNLNTEPNENVTVGNATYTNTYRALKAPSGTGGGTWPTGAATAGDPCIVGNYYNIPGFGYSGFSDFAPGGGNGNTTALPVKLIYLTASPVETSSIRLEWATATEINNEGFEVERSTDGITFEKIGFVAGNGNSSTMLTYSFNDYKADADVVYYYRLKQLDYDGKYEYTYIVSAALRSAGETTTVRVQPIPANDKVNVLVNTSIASNTHIKIVNVLGQEVISKAVATTKGENNIALDIAHLPACNYIVFITTDAKVFSVKLPVSR